MPISKDLLMASLNFKLVGGNNRKKIVFTNKAGTKFYLSKSSRIGTELHIALTSQTEDSKCFRNLVAGRVYNELLTYKRRGKLVIVC